MALPLSKKGATALKPYATPDATLLGSIDSLTAGPESGALDCLFGTTPGGFGEQETPVDCATS